MTTLQPGRAVAGLALALPVALLLTMLVSGVQPDVPWIRGLSSRQGSLVFIALLALAPVGLAINLRAALRRSPGNVAAALFAFAVIATVVALVIEDQYPCWVGVPNCD